MNDVGFRNKDTPLNVRFDEGLKCFGDIWKDEWQGL